MSQRKREQRVREMWEAMEAREWARVRALIPDHFVTTWPASRERIVGADNYLRSIRRGWHIHVLDMGTVGARVVSRVRVSHPDGLFEALSWFDFEGDAPTRLVEYWVTWGADPRPTQRSHLAEPMEPPR